MNLNKYVFSVLALGLLIPSISSAMDGQADQKQQAQQAEQKRAQQNNDNQIPWKKNAADVGATIIGALSGYAIQSLWKNTTIEQEVKFPLNFFFKLSLTSSLLVWPNAIATSIGGSGAVELASLFSTAILTSLN